MTRDIVDTALDSGLCCKLRQVWLLRPLVLQSTLTLLQSTLRVILPLADPRVARVVPRNLRRPFANLQVILFTFQIEAFAKVALRMYQ